MASNSDLHIVSAEELEGRGRQILHKTLIANKFKVKDVKFSTAKDLGEINPGSLLIPLGDALQALDSDYSSPLHWWGYPTQWNPHLVYPLFHPNMLLSNTHYLPVFQRAFKRGLEFWRGDLAPWRWPEIEIGCTPRASQLLLRLENSDWVGLDIESAGKSPYTADLLCLGLGNEKGGVSFSWPINNPRFERRVLALLRNPRVGKVLHNKSFDLVALRARGIEVGGPTYDTMHAHHAIIPFPSHALTHVAASELPCPRWKSIYKVYDDRKGADAWKGIRHNETKFRALRDYNAKDCIGTAMLRPRLETQVKKTKGGPAFFKLLDKLDVISQKMKDWGIKIDEKKRLDHAERLEGEVEKAKDRLNSLVEGLDLEIGDDPDGWIRKNRKLHKLFYDIYDLPVKQRTKTGQPKMDKEVLEKICMEYPADTPPHKAARAVLTYRKWAKDYSTYVCRRSEENKKGIPIDENGLVHGEWRAGMLITGRWACKAPNLQNIPKPSPGRPSMRDMYTVRCPDNWFVAADYQQLELRIIALLSKDPLLLEAYANGDDVHQLNADVLGCSRKLAKTFVYLTNYGGGPEKGAQGMVKEGFESFAGPKGVVAFRMMQDKWFEAHPAIKDWQFRTIQKARRWDYVELPLSKRRIPFFMGRAKPTDVCNYPIQGTAADIVNAATVRADKLLDWKKEGLVLQIHDDLTFEGPDWRELAEIAKESMETEVEWGGNTMRFPIDVSMGTNWGELKEVEV